MFSQLHYFSFVELTRMLFQQELTRFTNLQILFSQLQHSNECNWKNKFVNKNLHDLQFYKNVFPITALPLLIYRIYVFQNTTFWSVKKVELKRVKFGK